MPKRTGTTKKRAQTQRSYNDKKVVSTFHKLPVTVLLLVATGLAGLVGYQVVSNLNFSSAATAIFDGSSVAKWNDNQWTSGCGSYIKDVAAAPPGQSGSATEVFLKDGCRWTNDDSNKERVELGTSHGQFTFKEGSVWYIDFWQRFDQLANTHSGSDWDIWLQTHFTGGGNQPNIVMATDGTNRMELKTSVGCSHAMQWLGPQIATGQWYRFTLGIKFSASSSNGWIELKKDGTTVLPRKGVAVLGTTNQRCNSDSPAFDATYGYLKKGIYRNAGTSGNEKYTMYGLKVYSSDPISSTTTPPPVTPPPTTTPPPTAPPATSTDAWSSWSYTNSATVSNAGGLTMQFNVNTSTYRIGQTEEYCLAVPSTVSAPTKVTFTAAYNPNGYNTVYLSANGKKLWQVSDTGGAATTKTNTVVLQGQRSICFGNTINTNFTGNFPVARYLKVTNYSVY